MKKQNLFLKYMILMEMDLLQKMTSALSYLLFQ